MAIGTTAAILGGAALVGGIGGSMMGASATRGAARDASNAQQQVAAQNNALARDFRNENTANFAPWMQSGGRANALVDSFLYGQPGQAPGTTQGANGVQIAPDGTRSWTGHSSPHLPGNEAKVQGQRVGNALLGGTGPAALAHNMGGEPMGIVGGPGFQDVAGAASNYGGWLTNVNGGLGGGGQQPGAGVGGGVPPASQQGAAMGDGMSGYEAFVNSPYYQHPLQEGMRSINQGYAAGGMLQSGDAMKAINKFGQDYGAGRMGEFIGLAERQSDRGLQGASAIAGVNQNALASMSGNNQNAANAMSNAAIARGNATAGMWSGIGSTIGSVAGGFMPSPFGGSSYGRGY